jgi:hypothetical protein
MKVCKRRIYSHFVSLLLVFEHLVYADISLFILLDDRIYDHAP